MKNKIVAKALNKKEMLRPILFFSVTAMFFAAMMMLTSSVHAENFSSNNSISYSLSADGDLDECTGCGCPPKLSNDEDKKDGGGCTGCGCPKG